MFFKYHHYNRNTLELGCPIENTSVQSLNHVQLFATPWTAACQASLSITNSWSLLKLMSIVSVMPSNHLILCRPLLLLPSIFPSTRVFSNESLLRIRWPKYWSLGFNICPSNEYSGLISFRMDWLDLLGVQGTLKSLLQHYSSKYQFFGTQLSLGEGNGNPLQSSCLENPRDGRAWWAAVYGVTQSRTRLKDLAAAEAAFFIVQLSHPYMITGKTIALNRRTFVGKVMSLFFHMLSRLVIAFLPRSKRLLIS